MSEYNIPFHIQEDIMKRLPVKSLIRFRSVSKAWKSLIDSSHFIAANTLHCHTHPQHHLLVLFRYPKQEINYVCFMDDETLSQQRPLPNSPPYFKENSYTKIVGISHGLVCFYHHKLKLAVICNPSIRKMIVVDVPDQQVVGFGVCPVTTDPKIVAVTNSNVKTSYKCEVMVYTLSSGNWRSLSTNLLTQPLQYCREVVAVGGFIYWHVAAPHNTIVSFDVTNESFQMIDLPTTLAHHHPRFLHMYKLRESLAIVQYYKSTHTNVVWMMEGGVQRSFAKLFTIHAPVFFLVGFRKSGVPILRVENDGKYELVVYEPNSEHNNVSKIFGGSFFSRLKSYMETLLLLGRSDCTSY